MDARPTADNQVQLSPADVTLIWEYVKEERRWHEREELCHDDGEKPLRFVPAFPDVVFEPTTWAVMEAARDSRVDQVVSSMLYGDVDVTVTWTQCGVLDALYFPSMRHVVLCYDNLVFPGFARLAAGHEMAHAVIGQLDLPITGNEEQAADELASLVAINTGRADDVLEAARVFAAMGDPKVSWADPHPPMAQRARDMRCLVYGSRGDNWLFGCVEYHRRAQSAWNRILEPHQ